MTTSHAHDLASMVIDAWTAAMQNSPTIIEQWRQVVQSCDECIAEAERVGDKSTVAYNQAIKQLAEVQLSQAVAEKMAQ